MANTKQAIKRTRQSEKNRQHNANHRSKIKTYIRKTIEAVKKDDSTLARSSFLKLQPILDRHAIKGLIHINKAARYKKRLIMKIKNMKNSSVV